MRFMTRLQNASALAAALLLALGMGPGDAEAATDTDNFLVSANVAAVCTITANDLVFGAYDPGAGDRDMSTDLNVECTPGTVYDVGLDGGATGNVAARQMSDGANPLNYGLYITNFGVTNWGNTVGVDTYNETSAPAGPHSLTVYGRIPGGQFTAAGLYNDNILATITF